MSALGSAGIDAAVAWWVARVETRAHQDAGDPVVNFAVRGLADAPAAPGRARAFGDALRTMIANALATARPEYPFVYLRVDYHPEGILAKAADAAGIGNPFPVKTTMIVERDYVVVSCGYRAPQARIYGDARWRVDLRTADYMGLMRLNCGDDEAEARRLYAAASEACTSIGGGSVDLSCDGVTVGRFERGLAL